MASFFVSRIDTAVDRLLGTRLQGAASPDQVTLLQSLLGKVAIANAKLAYQWYQEFIASDGWKAAVAKGARTQRLLWASTSTKNPRYRDVLYIEELIGTDTINTITPTTLGAFGDHGRARSSLTENVAQAHATLAALARAGVSIDAVTAQVLDNGIQVFVEAFDKLVDAIQRKLSTTGPGERLSMKRADLAVVAYAEPHDESACREIHRLDSHKHDVSNDHRMNQEKQ